MVDSLGFSMEPATKPSFRKSRRSSHRAKEPAVALLTDVFHGLAEMASHDDAVAIASQRSESDEQPAGKTPTHRTRGSRSSGTSSKKQPSISKRGSLAATEPLAIADDSLFPRDSITLARQQLTSSASRVRPSKQQSQQPAPQQQQQQASRSLRPTTRQVSHVQPPTRSSSFTNGHRAVGPSANNNNDHNNHDDDEPIVEDHNAGVENTYYHHHRGVAEWQVRYGVNQAGQLPSRNNHHLLDAAAGFAGLGDPQTDPQFTEDSPLGNLHDDRPPSRQRHAFPTHLLDARDLFSPAKLHDGSSSPITITPWHADEDDDGGDVTVDTASPEAATPEEEEEEEEDGDTSGSQHSKSDTKRPPSRYMTKAPRGGTSSSSSIASDDSPTSGTASGSHGRLPSRRGAAGSWSQAAQHHHDPKTDGFADLDERVPPPFRVEITTESTRSQYVPSDHRRADDERRHSLKSRRSSSFGSRAQVNTSLQQMQAIYGAVDAQEMQQQHAPLAGMRASSTRQSSKALMEPQWIAQDKDFFTGGLSADASRPAVLQRNSRTIAQSGSTDSTSSTGTNNSNGTNNTTPSAAHQWFRASNNPFFLTPMAAASSSPRPAAVASSVYDDDMDAETAIANTPLFSGENDLMAMTQLADDLHLDDFLGDPYVPTPPVPVPAIAKRTTVAALGVAASTAGTDPGAKPLHTSLGRDFLSLFAQH